MSSVRVDPHSPLELQLTQVRGLKNINTRIYAAAAMKLGLKLDILATNPSRIAIGNGKSQLIIELSLPDCNDSRACRRAWNKDKTYRLLENNDIPVPAYSRVRAQDFPSWKEMQETISDRANDRFPLVIKPVRGRKGRGVQVVRDDGELVSALCALSETGEKDLLLERFVHGSHYRIVLCRDQIVDVLNRKHASVTGDGESTIRELVDRQNRERSRFCMPLIPEALITCAVNVSADTVLEENKVQRLNELVNFSRGGTTSRVETASVHSENTELFGRISSLSGLVISCVDVIMPDISQHFRNQDWVVNEINHAPAQRLHYMADMAHSNQCAEGVLTQFFSSNE